ALTVDQPRRSFFVQAEDGIRDSSVTGVQTCALPICTTLAIAASPLLLAQPVSAGASASAPSKYSQSHQVVVAHQVLHPVKTDYRSEERRVGKECRSGGATDRGSATTERRRRTADEDA